MKYTLVMGAFAVALLAACQNTPALPTSAPTLAPTIAATTQPQIAPTETVAAAPATPTRAPRELPPTWTPTPAETDTPSPTEVLVTSTPFVPGAELPAGCKTFDIIFADSTQKFQVRTAPKIAWVPVDGAVRYHIQLGDVNGRIIKDDIYVAETSYTFDPTLFRAESSLYTWSVYPINQAGDQMCFAVGGEMYPSINAPDAPVTTAP